MKNITLTLIMLVLAFALLATISPFEQLNQNGQVIFSDKSGITIKNQKMYITFMEKSPSIYRIKLGVSLDYGVNFSYITIDSLYSKYFFQAPVLNVNEDNSVNVIY